MIHKGLFTDGGKKVIIEKRKKEKGKVTVPPSAILSKGHFVCESERGVSSGQGEKEKRGGEKDQCKNKKV